MNNSISRLTEGMATVLREEVIPHIDTEFARGQAYGVIYMLNSLRLRAAWSHEFVIEQVAAQLQLAGTLEPLLAGTSAPALPKAPTPELELNALEALRDANDASICALIDWKAANAVSLAPGLAAAVEAALRQCLDRQLKHEILTSAKPMFAEISSGAE
jgi:hypothetical protein